MTLLVLNNWALKYQIILLADSEGPSQIANLHSLIWASAVRKWP